MKIKQCHPYIIISLLSFHSIWYIKTDIERKKVFLFIEDEIWKHNFTRNCTCNQMIVHNLQLQHCPKQWAFPLLLFFQKGPFDGSIICVSLYTSYNFNVFTKYTSIIFSNSVYMMLIESSIRLIQDIMIIFFSHVFKWSQRF